MEVFQEYSCGVVPICKTDSGVWKILLIKHTLGEHWGFPKGHMEKGESCHDTALRELSEEVGIEDVEISKVTVDIYYDVLKRGQALRKKVTYFFGHIDYNVEVIPQPEEVSDHLWVEVREASKYLHKNMDPVIEKALIIIETELFKKYE